MADIMDDEEVDKDTVDSVALEKLFSKPYRLLTEKAVSLKKSYINKLSGTKSLKLAATLLDNSIEVYELNTSLSKICRLSGHSKSISDVVFNQKEDHLLYSTGQDGCVKLWDTRISGSCVQEYVEQDGAQTKPFDCMDISCNSRILCAGSLTVQDDAYLVFWDQRQPQAALGGYWNSHTDDITQVRFHKDKVYTLASGSVDGLLNIFNIMESEEDDALLYSLNVENSVAKISWLDDTKVSCITQSNDLQIWDSGSGDQLSSFSRDKVARSMKRSKGDDCYLVDTFVSSDGAPAVLAGSNGGDGECLRSVEIADKKLAPSTDFRENKQIVRCCWYDNNRDLLVTAGEGGILSVWSRGETPQNDSKLTASLNKLRVNRHRPY